MFPEQLLIKVSPDLQLRTVEPDDAVQLYLLIERNHRHFERYLPSLLTIDSLEAAREYIRDSQHMASLDTQVEYLVFYKGELSGAVRLNFFEPHNHKISIGYYLDFAKQGKGIIGQAVSSVIVFCFDMLDMNRIELRVDTTNKRSIAVAERLGFTREGELKQAEYLHGEYVDHFVYALLKKDRHKLTHK